MSLEDKIIMVTPPDYFHSDRPSLMLYDVSIDETELIVDALLKSEIDIVLHVANTGDEREWIVNTSKMCDRVIVNLEKTDLIKGYILNFAHVSYYNSDNDIKSMNINEIIDPLDYTLRLVHDRRNSNT